MNSAFFMGFQKYIASAPEVGQTIGFCRLSAAPLALTLSTRSVVRHIARILSRVKSHSGLLQWPAQQAIGRTDLDDAMAERRSRQCGVSQSPAGRSRFAESARVCSAQSWQAASTFRDSS